MSKDEEIKVLMWLLSRQSEVILLKCEVELLAKHLHRIGLRRVAPNWKLKP